MISKIFPGTVENIYKPYKTVEMETSPVASVAGCDGYVYVLDDKNLAVYDDKGAEQFSDILDFDDAFISNGKKRVLVYDRPSGAYIIFEEGEKIFEDTLAKSILGARMQDNGYAIFILKGKEGFLGSVAVLDDANGVVALYNYADRFPVSGCVIGDSGKIVVAGIFENDTDKTGIDIFEVYNDVPVAGLNRDYLLPLVLSMGDKNFVAAGTEKVSVYSDDGSEVSFYEYNEIIRAAASENGSWIADRKTGSDKIIYIAKSGEEKWVHASGLMTDGIIAGERHVFYWSGINAVCLDEKGKQVEMQGGFNQVLGIADIGNGKTVIVTAARLVFYEYH